MPNDAAPDSQAQLAEIIDLIKLHALPQLPSPTRTRLAACYRT
jgi:hypothetical protein